MHTINRGASYHTCNVQTLFNRQRFTLQRVNFNKYNYCINHFLETSDVGMFFDIHGFLRTPQSKYQCVLSGD